MKIKYVPIYEVLGGGNPEIAEKFQNAGLVGEIPTGEFDDDEDPLKSLVPVASHRYVVRASVTYLALSALASRQPMLITGPTGTGKSALILKIGELCNLPVTRFNLDGDVGRADIIGYPGIPNPSDPNDNGFREGALTRAIQHPGIILLDEWDAITPEVGMAFHPLLEEDNPGLMIPELGGFVQKHPDCWVVATSNTKGTGDSTGLYVGTSAQNVAQLNRFGVIMELLPPDESIAKGVLEALADEFGVAKEAIGKFLEYYKLCLRSYRDGHLSVPLSMRALRHAMSQFNALGDQAVYFSVIEKAVSPTEKQVLTELAVRAGLKVSDFETWAKSFMRKAGKSARDRGMVKKAQAASKFARSSR